MIYCDDNDHDAGDDYCECDDADDDDDDDFIHRHIHA